MTEQTWTDIVKAIKRVVADSPQRVQVGSDPRRAQSAAYYHARKIGLRVRTKYFEDTGVMLILLRST